MTLRRSGLAVVLVLAAIAVGTATLLLAQIESNRVHNDLQAYFAAQVEPPHASATRFTFGITGDIHVSHNSVVVLTKDGWKNLLARWRDAGHRFGVVVGDLGYGDTAGLRDVVDGWSETPGAPPVFYAMGNHEIDTPAGKRAWIDALYPGAVQGGSWSPTGSVAGNSDRAYWSFNVGPYWHFVMLDATIVDPADGSDYQGTLGIEQLNWVAADLAANQGRNVAVFVHEPIEQARYDTPYYTVNDRGILIDLLAAHPKKTHVFSGHLHSYRGITNWKGITSVHTSEPSDGGVSVSIDGETLAVSWPGMTAGDIVNYDQHPMYSVEVVAGQNVMRVGEEGGDYGRIREGSMSVVGAQNGVTPTYGSLMLKATATGWFNTWFISEQLVKIVPGMKFTYDIYAANMSSGKDPISVQPSWMTSDGSVPVVVTDQNGIPLSSHTRDSKVSKYYEDLPSLGGYATGRWYHREIDLTPLAGHYADGVWLATNTTVGTGNMYVDNITFTWPASSCSITLTPSNVTIGAAGGGGTVTVGASTPCGWTATSNATWITITTGANGVGSGTVGYSVQANSGGSGRVGTLTIGNQTFQITQSPPDPPPPDTMPPGVTVTAPADGATVGGTAVTLSADATDNVGVGGVQFLVDGAPVGSEDTAAPYTVTWNSTSVANGGPYQVTARARDLAGNQTTSAAARVTVDNTAVVAGLVAAFSFDEGAGTVVTDATGNGHTGTIAGAAWAMTGHSGRALSFDGTNDWVTINDAADLDVTRLTVMAWVRPTTLSGWRTVALKESNGGLAYGLYGHDNAPRPATYINVGSGDREAMGSSALPLNTWTHLTMTYDGTTLRLYVNGAQVGTLAVTGNIVATTSALRIGGNSVWGEYFAGLIDDVRLYNRALTQAEVQSDMNTSVRP